MPTLNPVGYLTNTNPLNGTITLGTSVNFKSVKAPVAYKLVGSAFVITGLVNVDIVVLAFSES